MYLKVKVKPGSRTDNIQRLTDGSLRIQIKAPPVDGKANVYLLKYLSRVLDIPASGISIKTGSRSSYKLIDILAEENYVLGKLEDGLEKTGAN